MIHCLWKGYFNLKFEVVQNGEVIETLELGEGSHKIGRDSSAKICLKSTQVSKNHALLVIKDDKAAIVDAGSSNGVFVNGILVKKQRFGKGDVIAIADFQIRLALNRKKMPSAASVPQNDGNLAMKMDFESMPQEQVEAQVAKKKPVEVLEEKVLLPFLQIIRLYDWRTVLAGILGLTLVLSVLLSIVPLVRWGQAVTTKEALGRAHSVLNQAVRENYRVLTKGNDNSKLTTDVVEKSDGFLDCYIVEAENKTVLAPSRFFNRSVTDPYADRAINKVLNAKEGESTVVSIERRDSTTYVVAQPIPYLTTENISEKELPKPYAVIVANFKIPNSITQIYEPLVEAIIFSVFLSLLAYFLIFKMVSAPVANLSEQLDAALKGEEVTIESTARWNELEGLATVMNFAVGRLKQEGGGKIGAVSSTDAEAEDTTYLSTIAEFEKGSTDALLVLNANKQVKFVSKIMEDLVGLRGQYAMNQNISDACKDQSFAGTSIDLCENVLQSLGETQVVNMDINGINRNVVGTGHKNSAGEIRFILITVKLGA